MKTPTPTIERLLATLATAALIGACGGGGGTASPTEPPADDGVTHTVEVIDSAYSPQSIQIEPGDTVRWVMRGTEPGHTVTEKNGVFDSGFVFGAVGDSYTRTFPESEAGETFEYFCQTHRQCCLMQGSVRVGGNAPAPSPGY